MSDPETILAHQDALLYGQGFLVDGKRVAPDRIVISQLAKPRNDRVRGEDNIAAELRDIANEMPCCQRQMHLEIAAQIVEQGQFMHPDTFGMQIEMEEMTVLIQRCCDWFDIEGQPDFVKDMRGMLARIDGEDGK